MMSRYGWRTGLLEVVMGAVGVCFLFPVYVLVTLSLKPPDEIARGGFALPANLYTDNYSAAWSSASLGAATANSFAVTVVSILILIPLGACAANYLASVKRGLGYGMYILFLLGIILPFQLAMVPLYQVVSAAGLIGTHAALVAFYVGLQLPLTVFLYTGFLRSLPREYSETALVDGAGHFQAFLRITFPLLRPVTGTVVILNAVFIWNDFFTPLLYLAGSGRETIPVMIYSFVGQFTAQWGLVFAAVVLAALPMLLVFLLLQRYVIKGFASGLKG